MAVLDGGGRRSRWRESTAVVPSPGVRNGPSSSLCSDAQSLFFSSPCMLSLSLLCLPQKLLFLFRFLLCCCWWQLLLATLLVTRQNDGGAASNGGGRETREREMSYCSSPLFFCFSVLSFYSLVSSSLPLSVCLPFSSSPKFCPPSFLSFSKNRLPPSVSFFSFFLPLSFVFSLLCIYSRRKRGAPYHCHGAG